MVYSTSLLAVAITCFSAVATVQALDVSNYQIDPKIPGDYLSFVNKWYGAVDKGDTPAVVAGFSDAPIPTTVYNGVVHTGKDSIKTLNEGGNTRTRFNQKLLNSTLVSLSPLEIITYLDADVTIIATGEVKAASSVAHLKFNNDAYYGQMFHFVEDAKYVTAA